VFNDVPESSSRTQKLRNPALLDQLGLMERSNGRRFVSSVSTPTEIAIQKLSIEVLEIPRKVWKFFRSCLTMGPLATLVENIGKNIPKKH